jgi:hypothetical protein
VLKALHIFSNAEERSSMYAEYGSFICSIYIILDGGFFEAF